MEERGTRSPSRLGWVGIALGVPFGAVLLMWLVILATREALHPKPEAIPSIRHRLPPAQLVAAVGRAQQVVRADISERRLPGVSVAVGAGGEIVWAEGFGWADVETHAPVSPDTRFRIGTASTMLTSAAIGRLMEEGRLRLDDEIQTYVPQFPKKQWPVTLRQAMADVGGIETGDDIEGPLSRHRCEKASEAVQYFASAPLLFEPGTQYMPSRYGWVLASAAVEGAANQPFVRSMRERIFLPLGMNNTGAESAAEENPEAWGEDAEDPPPARAVRDLVAKPLGLAETFPSRAGAPAKIYSPGFGPHPVVQYALHATPTRNLSCYAGGMAFFSTPSDLVRFGLAMSGGRVLQRGTVGVLQSSQRLVSGAETGFGLGWKVATAMVGGKARRWTGQASGMATVMAFGETGMVVAVTSASTSADTAAVALRVAAAFLEAGR